MTLRIRAIASDPPPERFRWEIYELEDEDVLVQSRVSFRKETTALKAGERAMGRVLADRALIARGLLDPAVAAYGIPPRNVPAHIHRVSQVHEVGAQPAASD